MIAKALLVIGVHGFDEMTSLLQLKRTRHSSDDEVNSTTVTAPLEAQKINDFGYQHCEHGWYDIQNQGVCNDYCRWVGSGCTYSANNAWFSCALAGKTDETPKEHTHYDAHSPLKKCSGQGATPPRLAAQTIYDWGHRDCAAAWFDLQNEGVCNDYCRWVGDQKYGCKYVEGKSWFSCALAGKTAETPREHTKDFLNKPYCSEKGAKVPKRCVRWFHALKSWSSRDLSKESGIFYKDKESALAACDKNLACEGVYGCKDGVSPCKWGYNTVDTVEDRTGRAYGLLGGRWGGATRPTFMAYHTWRCVVSQPWKWTLKGKR